MVYVLLADCVPGAGGPEPAQRYIPVNDILYNVTGRNISDWLVKTMEKYMMRRSVLSCRQHHSMFCFVSFGITDTCSSVCQVHFLTVKLLASKTALLDHGIYQPSDFSINKWNAVS